MATLVDSRVASRKFQREVRELLKMSPELRKRGWLIEATSFPTVRVTFLATRIQPPVAVLTVDLDFTNYNVVPPSVRLLHPVELTPIQISGPRLNGQGNATNLVVNEHPDTHEPFLCLAGVREYHTHPEHTGDAWDLHRYSGAGSLFVLLEHVWTYCVNSVTNFIVPSIVLDHVLVRQEPQP